MEPRISMTHSQGLSNNSLPESNQTNFSYWLIFLKIHSNIVLPSTHFRRGMFSDKILNTFFLSGFMLNDLYSIILTILANGKTMMFIIWKLLENLFPYKPHEALCKTYNLPGILQNFFFHRDNKTAGKVFFIFLVLSVVLYGCEIWSLTLREECRLRVLETRSWGEYLVPETWEWGVEKEWGTS